MGEDDDEEDRYRPRDMRYGRRYEQRDMRFDEQRNRRFDEQRDYRRNDRRENMRFGDRYERDEYDKREHDDRRVHGRRDHGRREHVDGDLGSIKMKIPSFQGRNDPEVYLEWEKKIELIFNYHRYSDEKK